MAGGTTEFAERYGPWALIVGASAGIGAAVADEAARRGLNVLTVARRAPLLEEGAAPPARHPRGGGADPGRRPDRPRCGRRHCGGDRRTRGRHAGLQRRRRTAGTSSRFRRPSTWTTSPSTAPCPPCSRHHFGRAMAARGHGAIALVSSMGALQGGKVFASYFAAKAYEWILAEGLWAELGEAGVDAVAYVVGATRTENYKGQIDGSSDADADAVDTRAAAERDDRDAEAGDARHRPQSAPAPLRPRRGGTAPARRARAGPHRVLAPRRRTPRRGRCCS